MEIQLKHKKRNCKFVWKKKDLEYTGEFEQE